MRASAAWLRVAMAGERPALSADACAKLPAIPADELLEIVDRHRIAPWINAALAVSRCEVPAALRERLRDLAARQAARSLAHYGELTRLLSAMEAIGIEAMVLKGPVLAEQIYPEPVLRPYNDVDLLVREPDFRAVAELLEQDGYQERFQNDADPLHPEHARLQRTFQLPGVGLVIDLHADHLQLGLRPVEIAEAWERSRAMRFGAGTARTMELHDMFVQLCVHLHRHGFARLIWFKDIDLLVRQGGLDWDRIEQLARIEGCWASVAYTLDLLPKMLGTPLPRGARRIASRRSRWMRIWQRLLWHPADVLDLKEQRRWRLRRAVQFAPEAGALRGGIPALLFGGRRGSKLRVLLTALPRGRRRASAALRGSRRPRSAG